MTTAPFVLERFDSGAASAIVVEAEVSDVELCGPDSISQEQVPEETLIDPSEPDGEDEDRAVEARKAEALAGIASYLSDLSKHRSAAEQEAHQRACAVFVEMSTELLPRLAGTVFRQRLEELVADLMRRAGHPKATLCVSDEDYGDVAQAFEHCEADVETCFTVRSAGDLIAGQARLEWPCGGAAIDAARFAADTFAQLSACLENSSVRSLSDG